MLSAAITLEFPKLWRLGTQDWQMLCLCEPFHTLKAKSCL